MNLVLCASYRTLTAGSTTQRNMITPPIRACERTTWSSWPSLGDQLQQPSLHDGNHQDANNPEWSKGIPIRICLWTLLIPMHACILKKFQNMDARISSLKRYSITGISSGTSTLGLGSFQSLLNREIEMWKLHDLALGEEKKKNEHNTRHHWYGRSLCRHIWINNRMIHLQAKTAWINNPVDGNSPHTFAKRESPERRTQLS
jgi:hypothetical protein